MFKNLTRIFVINLIIGVVIGLMSGDFDRWQTHFLSAFVFSQAIGLAIYLLIHLFWPLLERLSKLVRGLSLILLFLAGGVVGLVAGILAFRIFFGLEIDLGIPSNFLPPLALAIIFGSLGYLYLSMKENEEDMTKALKEKELHEERLKHLATKAELEALQSKINPHFLFNTLNSIASLIPENPEAAESTVEKLSEVFRSTLLLSQKDVIKLSDELRIVRDYVELEQLRLGDRLRFEVRCDPSLADAMLIPGLTIQPLVENSIRHGVSPKPEGGGITVDIRRVGRRCVIEVADDGAGFQPEAEVKGHGLSNVRDRLKLRYGEEAGFEIRRTNGTCIIISLPMVQD
jgi:sensor histidine kinase YesM